jgi:hypothetical protein
MMVAALEFLPAYLSSELLCFIHMQGKVYSFLTDKRLTWINKIQRQPNLRLLFNYTSLTPQLPAGSLQ